MYFQQTRVIQRLPNLNVKKFERKKLVTAFKGNRTKFVGRSRRHGAARRGAARGGGVLTGPRRRDH